MKKTLAIILLFLWVTIVSAQDERPLVSNSDLPHFYADILNFPSDSARHTRVDVYIQAPFKMLAFNKIDNVFKASYEISISIFDHIDETIISEKIWTEEIQTNNYSESVSSSTGRISHRSFYLHPDEYTVLIQLRDVDTRKSEKFRKKITVKDFSVGSFRLSDIMVINRIAEENGKKAISPNISASIADATDSIPLLFETYSPKALTDVRLMISVENLSWKVVQTDSLHKQVTKKEQSCIIYLKGRELSAGRYNVKVRAMIQDDSTKLWKQVDSVSRPLIIRIQGLPTTIVNLDLAIDQLMYVATKTAMEEMRSAPPEKKKELFREFWDKRDPTKGTEANELMEEYYIRVDFANRSFTHYTDGWKTDMGNVYILYGEPSNIERHPFDIDSKPYEIWTYYELNREFVFVDDSGFGDYRLRTPIWDEGRSRYR